MSAWGDLVGWLLLLLSLIQLLRFVRSSFIASGKGCGCTTGTCQKKSNAAPAMQVLAFVPKKRG